MAPVFGGRSQPWVEKYRPRQVTDVAHQDEVVRTLQNTLKTGNLPHLLLYGPPGTGKTSTALAICRQLFGPDLVKSRVLELNASDDRGINVVRTKIKDFASIAVGSGVSGYPCPPFKIIILDEADSMTEDAQNALRRTMETHGKVTRFFFLCNYVSRIIEPLASRCAKYRFKPLGQEVMRARLSFIAAQEGLTVDDKVLSEIGKISEGDMRRAITALQSASSLHGSTITYEQVVEASGILPPAVMDGFLKACRSGAFDNVQTAVQSLIADGHPAAQLFSQLHDWVIEADDVSDEQKAAICMWMARADKALIDGADELLQLLNVSGHTMRALCGMPEIAG